MTLTLWTLIAIQIAMASFDTIYHHELTERLAWRPSQRHELTLHAARSLIYAALFLVLGFLEPHGVFAMLVIAALAVEVFVTLADFIEEDMSRKLPASERVNHTLLAINYGAILVLAAPVLLAWAGRADRDQARLAWILERADGVRGGRRGDLRPARPRGVAPARCGGHAARGPGDRVAAAPDRAGHRRDRLHRPAPGAGADHRGPSGDRAGARSRRAPRRSTRRSG